MSGTSDLPSGYDRDPRRAGAFTAHDPYAGNYQTEGLTALAGRLLILGGCWSFFAGLAVAVRKFYFTALPGYSTTSHYYAYHWNVSGWGWANLIPGSWSWPQASACCSARPGHGGRASSSP